LQRQIEKDDRGIPLGILDNHGRGLYISRAYLDRFVINLQPGRATEVVALNFIGHSADPGQKPLIINEI
jgi:hypothetical protein